MAVLQLGITTNNLTPNSGGYLSLLPPAGPVTTTADVFNLGASWSATTAKIQTGPAGQFDAFINTATAHLVVDVFGYFALPRYPLPMVYDADGAIVGRALGLTTVIVKVDGLDIPLMLDPNGPQPGGLLWSADYGLYFEDGSCGGDSFIYRGTPGQQRPAAVQKDFSGTYTLLMGATTPEQIHAGSYSQRYGFCSATNENLTAWRLQAPRPLIGYGKLPFYIK